MSATPDAAVVASVKRAQGADAVRGASRRDFLANPVAVFGLVLLGLIVLAAIFAPLISPQNPYDLAQIDVMDSKLPPGSAVADRRHVLARHRRPGPRHAVGDLLRLAHFVSPSARSRR